MFTAPEVKMESEFLIIKGNEIPLPKSDDYCIVHEAEGKKKKLLVKVLNASHENMDMRVVLHDGIEKEEQYDTFPYSHIFMNLGPNPTEGVTIAGVKIELWRRNIETSLGTLSFYRDLDEHETDVLKRSIRKSSEILEEHGLDEVLPVHLYVRPKKGKYDGTYKPVKKNGEFDKLTIQPDEYDSRMLHLLLHELMHGVDIHMVPDSIRAEWIKRFHKHVNVQKVDDIVIELLEEFIEFRDEWEGHDEKENILDECFKYIWRIHVITKKDLVSVLNAGDSGFVRSIWPRSLDLTSQEIVVSDYANTKAVEFFCEAMSHYLEPNLRDKLPEDIQTLCQQTIDEIRA